MFNKKEIRQSFIRGMGKNSGILLAGIFIGFLALCLVHMLPVERMHQNVLNSKDAIGAYAQAVMGYTSTTIDNYTDSIILNQAICPVDAPLLEKAVYNYQVNYWKQYEQMQNLYNYLGGGTEDLGYQGYTHYWGGYLVILKPLLLIFDFADILVINMILQTLLTALIITGLYRTGKKHIILPFLTAILSMMPITAAVCLQLCDIYYIMLIGTACIVWKHEKIRNDRMYILFLLIGMATSYFDFLTYPLVSLGIPLVVFLSYLDDSKLLERLFYLILCSAEWCIGYIGMWMGKWILGSILVPESGSLAVAIESIHYRSSNRSSDRAKLTMIDVLLKNMFVYLKWPIILLIGGIAIYLAVRLITAGNLSRRRMWSLIPYIMICFYPIAWYMMAKNHSYEHAFMAYRVLSIAAFAGLCMLAEAGQNTELLRKGLE